VREDFEIRDGQERSGVGVIMAALLLGTAAAMALVLWWRRREEDGGAGTPPPGESICWVDVAKDARVTLDAHGNVRGFERTVPVRIPPGDTRRYGIKWIVNNRHGAVARDVHMGNMRRGSKAGRQEDIFESGSDRAVIAAGREQHFFSCILSDAAEGHYFYDILIDGKIKIDPEIAIIRR
jgi:hypothetical protein